MKVHVIGAGGVGYPLAWGLIGGEIHLEDLYIYDPDDHQGGLGHMRLPRALPTTKKVDSLKGTSRMLFGVTLQVICKRFTGNEPEEGDLVVDCSDMSHRTRKMVWNRARAKGANMLRVSYDGRNSTIVITNGLPFSAGLNAGYADVPTRALSLGAGGLGAEAINLIAKSPFGTEFISMQISLSDFIKPLTEEQALERQRLKEQTPVTKAITRSKKKKTKKLKARAASA